MKGQIYDTINGKVYGVQVAAPLASLQQGLRDALWLLVPMFPLMLALASAGGYFMSRRALAPVDRITEMARLITAASCACTLPARGANAAHASQVARAPRCSQFMLQLSTYDDSMIL